MKKINSIVICTMLICSSMFANRLNEIDECIFSISDKIQAYSHNLKLSAGCNPADAPILTSSSPVVCKGDSIHIFVDMSSSLGDHGWWELFADSCTGQSLDTSVNGHFSITALRDRKYFVRGNGICFMQAPCDSISISVSNPFFTVSIQDESLPGANDGEILMQNESGGFPPYEFSKNNGSTYKDGGLFSSLTPGTYSLRLKDSFGCETMDSIHSELYWTLSGSSTLYGFKTDSTGYVEFPISSIFSDELNFHDSLGKFYWLDEYNGRFLSSLDYDGSSLDSIYKTINYLRNFWTQSPSTKLFVQNYDEELLVGDLVSEVGLMKIAGPFSDDIADLEYDVEHDILYVIDEDNFVSCLQSDGGNFQTLASIDTLNFDLRYLSLDANNGRLYTCGRYLELGYFDLVNKEFHLIAYNDSIQVEEMVFDAHHQVFHFAVSEPIYSLLEYRLGQSEFKTLYEFDNYPAGLTLFAPHHVEVCPKQAVKPDLSVNLLDPSCQGDTVILEVLNGDSLNSSDYWVLYKNLSGGKSIDTSFHGVFKIVSQEFAEYFVRGESQCGFGPWNSVSFGDSIPPNISCSNLSIHLDSSPYEINFQQIIPDITLSLDTALEEILQNFNAASPFIASQIPGQYIFIMDEGEDNTYYIDDGGEDMFDDANILNTNIVQEIEYTGGSIVQDSAFGDSGRYFTQYMDGLFFMAADRMNISFFSSTGDLGSDGEGQIIAREFSSSCGGKNYHGYVKSNNDGYSLEDGGDPGVNHLIIIEKNEGVSRNFASDLEYDDHSLSNLEQNSRIYYLLFATTAEELLSAEEARNIFEFVISGVLCGYEVPDNCGTARLISQRVGVDCSDVGLDEVIVYAVDGVGNVDSCTFELEVQDTVGPVIFCPSDTTIIIDSGLCGIVIDYGILSGYQTEHWARRVIDFSSEYSTTTWSAEKILGMPDVYPMYGDFEDAWAQETEDDQREFIEIEYLPPVNPYRIDIYETYNPGAVDTIYLRNYESGEWIIVWSDSAAVPNPPEQSRIFSVDFPQTSYLVDAVRLAINSPAIEGWNEYDAVALIDSVAQYESVEVNEICITSDGVLQTSGLPTGSYYPVGTTFNKFEVEDAGGNSATCSFTIEVMNQDSMCCSDTLLIDEIVIPTGIYRTNGIIIANGNIFQGSKVKFQAANGIFLDPSFFVEEKVLFNAIIGDCPELFPPPPPEPD